MTLFAEAPSSSSRHPVLDHGTLSGKPELYERGVARLMKMTEKEMLAFVPARPVARFCECPNCYGGVEGNSIFLWTIERPGEMKCRFCGTVFPNTKFPEDHTLEGKNGLGEVVSFNYYFNEKQKVSHFLTENLNLARRHWLMPQLVAAGKAYQATKKEKYARRVVLALERIARAYPHYPIMQNGIRRFRFRDSQKIPFPWDSGRWGSFHDEISKNAVNAYDLVYDSGEWARLSQERGYDVRKKVEEDFFKAAFRAVEIQTHHMSNIIGYDVAAAAMLGRVLGEPRIVHWAWAWMKKTVLSGFFSDGMWHEAPSYHYMTLGGLKYAFGTVRGYTDPSGYVDAEDGSHFENLDPEKELPFLPRTQHAPEVLNFPDGSSTPVHDTWPHEKRAKPRDRTISTIAPAYGHASLGRGVGPAQMQAQLHFSGGYGHSHLDSLNLTLYARQREMLPDLGYTWTQMRWWNTSTLGHNTVVVNRRNQTQGHSDGNLLWYFPEANGVSAVEADGTRAYREVKGMELYRRLLLMVPVSEKDAYVIDIFRVQGGTVHDWSLHGDADVDTRATCSLPLTGKRANMLEPGEPWAEPKVQGSRFNPYGMLRELGKADTSEGFNVSFNYGDEEGRGIRIHIVPGGPSEVWLGRSPSVRRMGRGTHGDMRKAYDFWMPHLLVRRRGRSPLSSVFAAVHEPYAGKPFLDKVELLKVSPDRGQAIALRITHGETVDTLVQSLEEAPYLKRTTENGIVLRGKLGLVRQSHGKVTAGWLLEGQMLRAGKWQVAGHASAYGGKVLASQRIEDGDPANAFVVDGEVPPGEALRGQWMFLKDGQGYSHAFEIDRVDDFEGARRIVLENDPGLRTGKSMTEEVYFPQRKLPGASTFRIPQAVAVTAE